MPSLEEITRSLHGAWRLCLGDKRGLDAFERSFEAFWRSFAAIGLAAPIYALYLMAERAAPGRSPAGDSADATARVGDAAYFAINGASYVVEWIAFPLAMIFIARLIDRPRRYSLYITAYNWSSVILVLAISPPFILWGFGLLGEAVASVISIVALVFALRARYMIASIVLEAGWAVPAALVALEFILSMIIAQTTMQLTGAR